MSVTQEYQILDNFVKRIDQNKMDSVNRVSYMRHLVRSYFDLFEMKNVDANKFRGFSHAKEGLFSNWRGFIPHVGRHAGAMISMYEGEPFVFRGFPQFERLEENTVYTHTYPYIDGQRINLWTFPNGVYYGKTDSIEFLFRTAQNTVNYQAYLDMCPDWDNIHHMVLDLGDCYVVNGIIYGRDFSSFKHDFYDVESGFVVTHIEHRVTHEIVSDEHASFLCNAYGVKHISMLDENAVPERIHYNYTQDGDLFMYLDKSIYDKPEFDKRKAIVRDVWEGLCNNAYQKPHFAEFLEQYSHLYNALDLLDEREKILDYSIQNGKKVDVNWFVPWVLEKYAHLIDDMSAEEVYDKIQTRFTWSAYVDIYGKDFIIQKIAEWLKTADLKELGKNRSGRPMHYIGDEFIKKDDLAVPEWVK